MASSLPSVRLGRVVLYPVHALERWLDEQIEAEDAAVDAYAAKILENFK